MIAIQKPQRCLRVLQLAVIAFTIPFIYWAISHNASISLADEGFLWNNALLAYDGFIPMLDFRGHDPFRYYFCAPFISIFGRGILAIRIAMGVVQATCIFFSFLLLDTILTKSDKKINILLLIILGIIIQIWLASYHKSFDIAMPVFSSFSLYLLVTEKSKVCFVLSGIFTGFSALVGRNHGAYNLLIFSGAILYFWIFLERSKIFRKIFLFGAGVAIGYLPMILMIALIPNFFASFLNSIFGIVSRGYTNLKLPIPWPWTITFKNGLSYYNVSTFLIGFYFLLVVIVTLVFIIHKTMKIKKRKSDNIALAATVLAWTSLVYSHYAFSRADVGHVAHSIIPLLLLFFLSAFICQNRAIILIVTGAIIFYSFFAMGVFDRPFLKYINMYTSDYSLKNGEKIKSDIYTAQIVKEGQRMISRYEIDDRELFVAPYYPGLYPILGLQSPVYDAYILHNADEDLQEKTITDLQENNVKYIILSNHSIDGGKSSFATYYPTVYNYIFENYSIVPSDFPEGFHFLIYNSMEGE